MSNTLKSKIALGIVGLSLLASQLACTDGNKVVTDIGTAIQEGASQVVAEDCSNPASGTWAAATCTTSK